MANNDKDEAKKTAKLDQAQVDTKHLTQALSRSAMLLQRTYVRLKQRDPDYYDTEVDQELAKYPDMTK